MTYRLGLLALTAMLLSGLRATARDRQGVDFAENKGQWADSIRYAAVLPGGMLHLTDKGFCYYYVSDTDMQRITRLKGAGRKVDSEQVHLHNYRVSYAGGQQPVSYSTAEKRKRYLNFFPGRDTTRWRGEVGLYGKVVQHGVYAGIDVSVYSKGASLKYEFDVSPGADPAHIRLDFEGVQPRILADGRLLIRTSVNEVTEQAPYAYQVIGGRQVPVPCHFRLQGQRLSFSLPQGYDTTYALIIDPELVFTTFSGGGDFANGYFSFCTTYDRHGCLYAAGVPVWGIWLYPPLWPTTPGAFQTTYSTIYGPMVCLNKYTADGSDLVYSTYYGGGGPNDLPHSMIVNAQDELILAGSTGSFNLPVTTGCFDSTKSGGTDIFIAHFNASCSALIGATYVGGNIGNSINGVDMLSTFGLDAGSRNKTSPIELALDTAGNIWAVSNTSTSDFPVTANAFQPAIGGGNCDGVVFALNPTCTHLVYGSFAGGSGSDAAYGIQFSHTGNVVICGGTKSADFPTTAGSLMPSAPGTGADWDGFVSVINPVSGALVASSYLGTRQDDQAVNLQLDGADNVYVLGRTFGNYPVSPNVYAMAGTDLFIQKLTPGLDVSLLSTRLGNPQGGNPLFPVAFLVDNCTNVYVAGLSQDYQVPLSGMPLTPDAFQTTPGNFWFGVLRPGFSDLLFATYYGRVNDSAAGINGDHTHVGAHHMDPNGVLYQSLCVNSPDYPGTTPQSWSEFNQNTVGQDIVSFKFAFQLAGVTAGFSLAPGQKDSGCAPFSIQTESEATMAMDYTWDFGDGSPLSHAASPSHTYTQAGIYTVMLHAHNDTTCITDDTAYRTITVFDPHPPSITLHDTLVCSVTDALTLRVDVDSPTTHNVFLWGPAAAIFGPADRDSVQVNPQTDTLFTVTVWDTIAGFCGYHTTGTVRVDYKPRAVAILNNDTLVCRGDIFALRATGTAGYSYQWTPATGIADPDAANTLLTALQTDSFILTAAYPGCPDTAQALWVQVDTPVGATFTALPDSICSGQSVTFYPQTDSTATELRWRFGDGSAMTGGNERAVHHAYDSTGPLPVMLSAHFRACPDTSFTGIVYVYALPYVDLGPDTALCLRGAPLYLQNLREQAGVLHHLWNTGDTTAMLRVIHPGTYTLRVSAEPLGCTTTESVTVSRDCYIDLPNAFTPNGDGVNDYFFPRQLLGRSLSAFRMRIYNRWGETVFATERTDGRGWDGRFNGVSQPQGVYIYQVTATLRNGNTESYQGNVTLLR